MDEKKGAAAPFFYFRDIGNKAVLLLFSAA